MRHILVGTLFTTIATVAGAQPVTVQSGEHSDFTRLVFLFRDKVEWSLEPTDNGYAFSVNKPDIRYNLDDVFYFIPRTRITDLYPVDGASTLDISIPQGIELTAFELASGEVVVDARQAPARPQEMVSPESKTPEIEVSEPEVVLSTGPSSSTPIALPDPDFYWRMADQLQLDSPAISTPATEAPAQEARMSQPAAAIPVEDVLSLDNFLEQEDDRVSEAETQLLHQLSRAASQGLIELQLPEIAEPAPTPDIPAELPPEPSRKTDHIAIHSETVVDRDAGSLQEQIGDLLGEDRCASNSEFALREWSEEGDPFALISNLRRSLIGEFDKPDEHIALRLAQTYLSFGFGTEANSIIGNFPVDPEAQDAVRLMANVIDGEPVNQRNPLLRMSACNGSVAFWALMGQETPDPLEVDLQAVQRTYSDLPISLRRDLGVKLADKLIGLGYPEAAETVRFSLERGEEEKSLQAVMLDATIDKAHEPASNIERNLKPVVERDNSDSVDATLMIAESAFRDRHPMDETVLENAAALAVELLPSEDGAKLLRADALGRATRADWHGALTTLKDWPNDVGTEIKNATAVEILQRAIRDLDDQSMLVFYFQHKDEILEFPLARDDREHIAERLISLGLPENVKNLLADEGPLTEKSRILMAKASLIEHDGPAAVTYVSGIEGDEAEEIRNRARNYFMGGDPLNNGGATPNVADLDSKAALRNRNWDTIAELGTDPQKAFVEAFDLTNSDNQGPTEGSLAEAQFLLDQSEKERNSLNVLLDSLR